MKRIYYIIIGIIAAVYIILSILYINGIEAHAFLTVGITMWLGAAVLVILIQLNVIPGNKNEHVDNFDRTYFSKWLWTVDSIWAWGGAPSGKRTVLVAGKWKLEADDDE